jgi:low temperature requirement protein LtrA
VFVLAIGQLTHHLGTHMTWRGAIETLIMLVAVCGVWVFTTFEITLLDIARVATRAVTVAVMSLALFINAGIAHAFDDGPWLFVLPLLLAVLGPSAYTAFSGPSAKLRGHFVRVLVWGVISAPFWIAGALLDPKLRLWLWAVAAAIDLVGTFTAHPLPGRTLHSRRLPFDTDHIFERMRLFLIILLGETVLGIGRGIAEGHSDPMTLLAAAGGFVALVLLWFIHFGRAERLILEHASTVEDPIRTVHLGINGIYLVVVGLVTFAAGAEMVIAHPEATQAGIGGVLLLGGPIFYVGFQAVYFGTTTGHDWKPRVVTAAALGAGAVAAYWLPALVAVASVNVILLMLAIHLSRGRATREAGDTVPAPQGGNYRAQRKEARE